MQLNCKKRSSYMFLFSFRLDSENQCEFSLFLNGTGSFSRRRVPHQSILFAMVTVRCYYRIWKDMIASCDVIVKRKNMKYSSPYSWNVRNVEEEITQAFIFGSCVSHSFKNNNLVKVRNESTKKTRLIRFIILIEINNRHELSGAINKL